MHRRLYAPAAVLTVLLAATLNAGVRAQDAATPTAETPIAAATPAASVYSEITTRIFADDQPAAVEQGQLGLALVTVPPGAKIGAHFHPGSQFAAIQQGELTYTVDTGTVRIRRAGSEADGPWEDITAGETVVLAPGDAIRESPGDIHHAENTGDEPVLIWIASLFPDGSPRAIPAATPQV